MLNLEWVKHGGLITALPRRLPPAPRKAEIESLAKSTNKIGALPLDDAYGQPGATRKPKHVRAASWQGDLYAHLVDQHDPLVVVEFGSAFGVSGMYLASTLRRGRLYSFEINPAWAAIAERNIAAISDRYSLIRGAFEEHVDDIAGPIDLALVDGIHSYDFVIRQWQILQARMVPGGRLLFDDIDFNPGMRRAWEEIVAATQVVGAVVVSKRLGLIELASP
ncbi:MULTISPECIES: O-methyltransferase [unclassified Mycobacterium]|uniref:O-methyltransferase n=1 Tax=unclassified Mycobacterium TaxID=2642494 RepID=UPI000801D939|nr:MULTISPECIES: class I SAM-dependent methyltransferase [unclassified Mycobacterium]OBG70636.1 methyltransferase [Mycobacterium sp. E1214]OBH29423.1 methyltransferase [Mycobacterium sp. E1319]